MSIGRATTALGTFYYVAEDVYIAGVLRHGVPWEWEVLRIVLPRIPAEGPCNIIDVGAHIGTHSIPYARWVEGRGVVYAFEPQSVMTDLLRRNIEANGCAASVEVLRFAVGHLDGVEVSMEAVIRDGPNAGQPYHYEDARPFNYGGIQLGPGDEKVFMRTLDSFAFTDVALLKVDAEGAEPMVLWGARELIRRCRPLILFERNVKVITEPMRSMMSIPEEVEAFRIEEYTASLGYADPVHVGFEQHLLRPPPRG